MRRRTRPRPLHLALLLLAVVAAVTLPPHPPAAHATHSEPEACTGYVRTAVEVTTSGAVYESQTNACLGISTYTPASMPTDAIVRKRCLRNGATWDGCRWSNQLLILQGYGGSPVAWYGVLNSSWCAPCSNTWLTDSGRQYTGIYDFNKPGQAWAQAARSKSQGGGVRILLADGNSVAKSESSRYSQELYVP
jgi:hypothetical protein